MSPALRACLFLLVCSPVWLAPHSIGVGGPAVLVVVLLALTVFILWRENRSPAEVLGLGVSWKSIGYLGAGMVGGFLLIVVVALLAGLVLPFPWKVNSAFSRAAAMTVLAAHLWSAAAEELIFRGYSFERLIAGIGHWKAQLVTAVLFAVYHIAQGWPWQVALLGTTVGSLLFGVVFVCWRSVPAAIGVHAAANWAKALLLQDPPRAETFFAPLSPRPWTIQEMVIVGPILLNGLTLVACAVIWRWHLRRMNRAQR